MPSYLFNFLNQQVLLDFLVFAFLFLQEKREIREKTLFDNNTALFVRRCGMTKGGWLLLALFRCVVTAMRKTSCTRIIYTFCLGSLVHLVVVFVFCFLPACPKSAVRGTEVHASYYMPWYT